MFKGTKGVTRNRQSKKDRQCNGQVKRDKRTKNGRQNIAQKSKHWTTRTTVKTLYHKNIRIPGFYPK